MPPSPPPSLLIASYVGIFPSRATIVLVNDILSYCTVGTVVVLVRVFFFRSGTTILQYMTSDP